MEWKGELDGEYGAEAPMQVEKGGQLTSNVTLKANEIKDSRQRDNLQDSYVPLLVDRIRQNDPQAMTELYALLEKLSSGHCARRLGPHEVHDKLHDCFVAVATRVERGDLRDPRRLLGFARIISRRGVTEHLRRLAVERKGILFAGCQSTNVETPEEHLISMEKNRSVRKFLRHLPVTQREILVRSYLLEQDAATICKILRLTYTQYRLAKSRGKSRLRTLMQKSPQASPSLSA